MVSLATNHEPYRALVVDDSRIARELLTRILQRESLEVDVATSAEEALEYLTTHRPDVVFLDHSMPGMSGFEALRAIKANPKTATIPVMMFTSQSGGLYVSQARALGAIDVLFKDSLGEVDLANQLRKLGIFKPPEEGIKPVLESISRIAHPDPEPTQPEFATPIKQQERLVDLMREVVREELTSAKPKTPPPLSTLVTTNKVEEKHAEQEPKTDSNTPPDYSIKPLGGMPDSSNRYTNLFTSLGILVCGLLIGWGMNHFDNKANSLGANVELVETSAPSPAQDESLLAFSGAQTDPNKTGTSPTIDGEPLLDVIAWALNQRMDYQFGEPPLSDSRMEQVRSLLGFLANSGFQGDVKLKIHHGEFCLVMGADGINKVPEASTQLAQCNRQIPDYDTPISQLMTIPFANFIDNYPLANGESGIYLYVEQASPDDIVFQYPTDTAETAGDWNRVAAQNNRVEIEILPRH